jgi:purine-nucleoside phosphorylase
MYNFKALPATAIICLDFSIIKGLKPLGLRKLKGIKGHNFIKKSLLFCSGFDNGASGIIQLLEELRALKVCRFIFIGMAGILTEGISEGSCFAVRKAISGSGAVAFYSEKSELCPGNQEFYDRIKTGLDIEENVCFSVDTPYRETRPLLKAAIGRGAMLIEMECAAVYAFAGFYGLSAICLLTAADDLSNEWRPPNEHNGLFLRQKQLLQRILPLVS